MRPLMTAEPMLRAGKPETDAESNLMGACAMAFAANTTNQNMQQQQTSGRRFLAEHAVAILVKSSQSNVVTENTTLMRCQVYLLFAVGILKNESSSGILASILSKVILAWSPGLSFVLASIENG